MCRTSISAVLARKQALVYFAERTDPGIAALINAMPDDSSHSTRLTDKKQEAYIVMAQEILISKVEAMHSATGEDLPRRYDTTASGERWLVPTLTGRPPSTATVQSKTCSGKTSGKSPPTVESNTSNGKTGSESPHTVESKASGGKISSKPPPPPPGYLVYAHTVGGPGYALFNGKAERTAHLAPDADIWSNPHIPACANRDNCYGSRLPDLYDTPTMAESKSTTSSSPEPMELQCGHRVCAQCVSQYSYLQHNLCDLCCTALKNRTRVLATMRKELLDTVLTIADLTNVDPDAQVEDMSDGEDDDNDEDNHPQHPVQQQHQQDDLLARLQQLNQTAPPPVNISIDTTLASSNNKRKAADETSHSVACPYCAKSYKKSQKPYKDHVASCSKRLSTPTEATAHSDIMQD